MQFKKTSQVKLRAGNNEIVLFNLKTTEDMPMVIISHLLDK